MLKIKIGYNFLEFEALPKEIENKYNFEERNGKHRITEKPEKLFAVLYALAKDYDIELI